MATEFINEPDFLPDCLWRSYLSCYRGVWGDFRDLAGASRRNCDGYAVPLLRQRSVKSRLLTELRAYTSARMRKQIQKLFPRFTNPSCKNGYNKTTTL